MHTPRTTGAIAESRTLQLGFASILIAFIAVILVSGSLGIPHEDSSIIYSYAENLATTGVISYSPGGERAEGATPFLWMVCLALLHILGVGTHLAAAILNALAVLAFHTFWRHAAAADSTIVKGSATLATVVFFTPMFASGAVGAGLAGFSTVAFCTLIAITFLSACLRVNSRLAVIALILLPLVRPDGLMFLVAIVASVILFEFAVLLVV